MKKFTVKTPLGIKVVYNQVAADQYLTKWGMSIEGINLDRVDRICVAVIKWFKAEKRVKPSKLKVKIMAWDPTCVGYEEGITRFRFGTAGCIQGTQDQSTVFINLGRNSGTGEDAFKNIPLSHEICHWVVEKMGKPCNDFDGHDCGFPSDLELGLCR